MNTCTKKYYISCISCNGKIWKHEWHGSFSFVHCWSWRL